MPGGVAGAAGVVEPGRTTRGVPDDTRPDSLLDADLMSMRPMAARVPVSRVGIADHEALMRTGSG